MLGRGERLGFATTNRITSAEVMHPGDFRVGLKSNDYDPIKGRVNSGCKALGLGPSKHRLKSTSSESELGDTVETNFQCDKALVVSRH